MKENWEIRKLGDCFDIIRNGANIKQYSNADGYPITRIETTSNDVFNRDKLGYANIYEIDKYKDYVLKNNDILISHINSTKYLGRAVLYEKQKEETIIHGMNLLNLSGINSNILPQFLVYYFKTESYKLQIFKITKKAVNQASFTTTALKAIDIPIPSLPIQEAIVKELDILHHLKELQERQLVEYDNLAQSTFYSMFGDPIENEKGWEVRKLVEVAPVNSFKGNVQKFNNKFWLLNLDAVEQQSGQILSVNLVEESEINQSTVKFNEDNVLYSKLRPYLNKVVIPHTSGYCTSELLPLLPQKDLLNRLFLTLLLRSQSFVQYIQEKTNGAKMPRVNMDEFRSFKLIIPPLPLQTAFAERIEKIEAQKELVKQGIAETQLLIDYTMDKYFG